MDGVAEGGGGGFIDEFDVGEIELFGGGLEPAEVALEGADGDAEDDERRVDALGFDGGPDGPEELEGDGFGVV